MQLPSGQTIFPEKNLLSICSELAQFPVLKTRIYPCTTWYTDISTWYFWKAHITMYNVTLYKYIVIFHYIINVMDDDDLNLRCKQNLKKILKSPKILKYLKHSNILTHNIMHINENKFY